MEVSFKSLNGKTVLVTGGAGFMGSNFIRYLKGKCADCNIICFDKLTYAADRSNLDAPTPLCTFIKGDICSADDVSRALDTTSPDVVVNFAAESHVDRSITDPSLFSLANTHGAVELMNCLLSYREKIGKNIRFHQISTDEVYGDLPIKEEREGACGFAESDPLTPSSPYAASKAAADLFVTSYCRTYGLDATISRSSNNYGRYQYREKFIPFAVLCAVTGRMIPIYGDGKNQREWLYVDDHSEAVMNIITHGRSGEIFNVGSRSVMDNNRLARFILEALGKDSGLVEYVADRKGHDRAYSMDCSKYLDRFGELPDRADLEKRLYETVHWYAERFLAK